MIKTGNQTVCDQDVKKSNYINQVVTIPMEEFLKSSSAKNRYKQSNLKRIYFRTKGIKPTVNMNFFIKNGFIAIAPEMLGFEKDADILLAALEQKINNKKIAR